MAIANFQFERRKNYELYKKTIAADHTIKTGRAADGFHFDNPLIISDPAANVALTLPDGSYEGQTLLINLASNTNSKTITVTASTGSGGDSTLTTAGQYMYLLWVDSTTGWVAVKESVAS